MERPPIEGILERAELLDLFGAWEIKRLSKYALLLEKALELAIVNGKLCGCCPVADICGDDDNCIDQLNIYFLTQAKEARDGETP